MKKRILEYLCAIAVSVLLGACSSAKSGSTADHATDEVLTINTSYNELTMKLDPTGVSYTIDVSTPEGRAKLRKISLKEAKQLALVECIIKHNCVTLFNPQYTHLVNGKDVLRVTVYGFPARYKNTNE